MSSAINLTEDQEAKRQIDEIVKGCGSRLSPDDKKMVYKAFELAMEAHKGVRRKSGELYIMHPLAVARIVADEIMLRGVGITAALLHDVVEDTNYTLEDIQSMFGNKVASIVDGLTKLEGVFEQTQSKQIENFRKLLLTMVDDIRIILIKLADRLHNMRTLDSMPDHKKLKIASETLLIYAPLAQRLGLYKIKSELEDLSFKYQHPATYKEISDKLHEYRCKNDWLITRCSLPISNNLINKGYDFIPVSRSKSVYSIWRKMQKQRIPFEEVYDLLALRIIFKPKPDIPEKSQCLDIYSVITDLFKPKPERLRDWVSVPKANGYEALHLTVMGPDGQWIEIQIRSERMNEAAERGVTAHWKYKGDDDPHLPELEDWLKRIRESLENPELNSLEFLDDFKMNTYSSGMMIFTPKGDMKLMPKEATVLDLAFEIHTNLGYKCIGAKVNNKLESLSHQLKSGDQVEILTSEKQSPKYEWLNYVTTSKAKTRIKETFKEERKGFIQNGEKALEETLNMKKLTINAKILKKLQDYYNIENRDELYYRIGQKTIHLDNLQEILSDKTTNKWVRYWHLSFGQDSIIKLPIGKKKKEPASMNLSDDKQEEYNIGTCCNPIPGDDVVGYRNERGKLILHSRNCPKAILLMSSHGDRIVSANWTSHKVFSYLAKITLSGIDQVGVVSKITRTISEDQNVNMRSIRFDSHDGIFEGSIYLYIPDTEDLNTVIKKISDIKGIQTVARQERINEK
ncbi:MAG: RelA/SpoT family protein [Cytophagaceae bacterium]|jgi:GTP pyrophosphokinase|nr:RelA/SpoT family protein [Cytophagaceae bacterium]